MRDGAPEGNLECRPASSGQRASLGRACGNGGVEASRQLDRIAATPSQLSGSGVSPNKTIPPMEAITSRRSVYGPRLEALAYLTATIPKYIPTGPNTRTPDNHGQISDAGSFVVITTGRLQT